MNNNLYKRYLYVGIFFLFFLSFMSIMIGRYSISITDLFYNNNNANTIIWNIRVPRILAALIVGASLSVSGVAFQGVFYNPIASPYLLGASSGAALGASLGLFLGLNYFFVQLLAFIFGNFAVAIALFISRNSRDNSGISLILAGIVIGSIFSSLISLLKLMAETNTKLPEIIYWLMGSMSNISNTNIVMILPIFIISLFILYRYRWKLNILSLGDEEAKRLGENPQTLRYIIIITSTLLTTISVSLAGVIGWVGLVIPHIGRILIGANFQKLIPFSAIYGALYLLMIDNFCRTLFVFEIPIGILTSLLGAPLFIWLLSKKNSRWG